MMPAWHPNFRNFERLPDTKVVRTAFFVNVVAILVALVLLVWFGYREYQRRDVVRQIAYLDAQIAHDQHASDEAVALYKKFQTAASSLGEIDAFIKSRPGGSDLLLHVAETLPHNLALDSFEIREGGLRLVESIRGAPDQASGYASTYLEQLRSDAKFKAQFESAELLNLNRQSSSGRLLAEFVLTLKGAGKKK